MGISCAGGRGWEGNRAETIRDQIRSNRQPATAQKITRQKHAMPMIKAVIGALALAASSSAAAAAAKAPDYAYPQPQPPAPPIARPDFLPYPFNSGRPLPPSPPRNRTCFVQPGDPEGGGDEGGEFDDAPAILAAFESCNGGGTVVLDQSYTIASPLDLTFLAHVDVALSGTVRFGNTVDYWSENSFKYNFQNMSGYWQFGGEDVNIYGGGVGVLDGNGQPFWDQFAETPGMKRPIVMVLDGVRGGTITGLRMVDSPNWFNFIANSSDIFISDMVIEARTRSENPVKNSDGWDTYRSDHVVIQDSYVDNTDDCVSFKPNSTDVVVQGLRCNGSHGISVGSLGQYADLFDVVENIYVYDNFMSNASDAARIKVWPGIDTDFQPGLGGGGGAGYVRNVTYERYESDNNDWAIEVNQCYGQSNQTLCEIYPVSSLSLFLSPFPCSRYTDRLHAVQHDHLGHLLHRHVGDDVRGQRPQRRHPGVLLARGEFFFLPFFLSSLFSPIFHSTPPNISYFPPTR